MGARYGYTEDNLGAGCYFPADELKLDYEAIYADGEPVPETFSFLTYNMWGLSVKSDLERLFRLRKNLLQQTIANSGADLICLQEMSEFSYSELAEFIASYKFASEIPYPANRSLRNRNAEVYFISKYKPSRVSIYGLRGVLSYENSLMIVEYPNLIVFNLYTQAGSKSSPGQAEKWLHYARCRYDILQTVHDIIRAKYADKNCILCGDFNCNLDGDPEDWPELEMLDTMKSGLGFVDTFRKLNPDDPGFTEDTDRNHMRWNQKLIPKKYRYDGVLYRGASWIPRTSTLIGTESACLTDEDSEWFLKNLSDAYGGREGQLKGCKVAPGSGRLLLPINPSDHFGVLTVFGKMGGRRKKRFKTRRVKRNR
jgi:exonuclease III